MACPVPVGTITLDKDCHPPVSYEEALLTEKTCLGGLKKDPKFFKRIKISALSALKIITHAADGVTEGINDPDRKCPIEVMGLLFGYVDPKDKECIVITDSSRIPCKGGAHSAIPDARTASYEAEYRQWILEKNTRSFTPPSTAADDDDDEQEPVPCIGEVGWYHSHPFDPIRGSSGCNHHHCWFSAIDVNTQTIRQQFRDHKGLPYVGLVVDPLTTFLKRRVHFGCFRVYNKFFPDHKKKAETPDGKSLQIFGPSANNARWGDRWNSYYALDVEFYTNPQNRKLLSILSAPRGWINDLVLTSNEDNSAGVMRNRAMKQVKLDTEKIVSEMRDAKKMFPNRANSENSKLKPTPFESALTGASKVALDYAADSTKRMVYDGLKMCRICDD